MDAPAFSAEKRPPLVDTSIIAQARADAWGHPLWIGGGVIFFLIALAPDLLRTFIPLFEQNTPSGLLISNLLNITTGIIWITLAATYQREYLQKLRSGVPRFSGIFNTLGSEYTLILLSVILCLPSLIAWLPFRGAWTSEDWVVKLLISTSVQVGVAVCLFPFQFAPLFVVDQGESAIGALRESWRYTMRAPLSTLCFLALTSLIGFLGAFACGIGLIFTLPIQLLSMPRHYEEGRNISPVVVQ
jgi:hypothetical protein